MQQVQGTLLAFLDADDLWTANKLSLQLNRLSAAPELSFISGSVEQFYEAGVARNVGERSWVMSSCLPGTVLIGRAIFSASG